MLPLLQPLKKFFLQPVTDTFYGLEGCLDRGTRSLLLILLGLLLGWWIYVPIHELLHAGACVAAGGSISQLEIDPLYFGGLLAQIFPWVTAGSEYAGRLSGFDTGGSDLVYLMTDFGPFFLTLFPGVWWLRRAARGGQALAFGAALPFALAPLISLTGDAYEIGSIWVTRLPLWADTGTQTLLRGDDLFKKASELSQLGAAAPWLGLVLAAALGALWAFATYGLGAWVAGCLKQPQLIDSSKNI